MRVRFLLPQLMNKDYVALYHQALDELNDANGQIVRHHKDFRRIQDILDEVVNSANPRKMSDALRAIRNIVG